MTSIPSPFDALRSLLPVLGRGGAGGGPFDPLGDLPDLDDGPPRGPGHHARHGDGPAAPTGGTLRADGQAPLSLPEASQIADVLSAAIRQNPSHPLLRDLPQASPEVFRQWVVDVLTSPRSLMDGLPRETVASLAQATSAATALLRDAGPAMAQARAEGDAMRASIQAQAQQAGAERPPAMPRADGTRVPGMLAHAPGEARTPGDPRTMAVLAQAPPLPPRAENALPPGGLPLSGAPAGGPAQPPAPQAAHAHVAAPVDAARPADTPVPSWLQARVPDVALPARAERAGAAGEAMSSGGLPGLVGAAGITVAAVAQPAGTTFAHAPHEAIRARTPGERRRARDEAARDEAAREADARGREGDAERQGRGRNDTGRTDASTEPPHGSAASPGSGTHGATSVSSASGHTAMAGGRLQAYGTEEEDDDALAAGHLAPGEDDAAEKAPARTHQWLYWTLIAVTYGCLVSALGVMTPLGTALPIATDALPGWRNALTTVGLASGIWAWVLARRMR